MESINKHGGVRAGAPTTKMAFYGLCKIGFYGSAPPDPGDPGASKYQRDLIGNLAGSFITTTCSLL